VLLLLSLLQQLSCHQETAPSSAYPSLLRLLLLLPRSL
jgi:hypothetical protein